jgi:hypothetical protein
MGLYKKWKVITALFICASIFGFSSCYSKILIATDEEKNQTNQIESDKSITIECNGKSQNIKVKNANRSTIDKSITRCLMTKGFYGDEKSNRQIAELIKIMGDDTELFMFAPIDSMMNEKYRGETVFEALLLKAQSGFNSSKMMGKAFNMIKEIDGYPIQDFFGFVEKKIGAPKMVEIIIRTDENGTEFIGNTKEEEIQRNKDFLNLIKEAYYSNKIILKDYGKFYHIFREDIDH